MRTAVILAAAIASLATPASAQSLGQVLGAVTGLGTTAAYSSCGYSRGILAVTCQIDRVRQASSQISQQRQAARASRDWDMNRRRMVNAALQRACDAGDRDSCERSRPVSNRDESLVNALMAACREGDRRSCVRAEAISDLQYDGYGEEPRSYAQARDAVDPRTGYRLAR